METLPIHQAKDSENNQAQPIVVPSDQPGAATGLYVSCHCTEGKQRPQKSSAHAQEPMANQHPQRITQGLPTSTHGPWLDVQTGERTQNKTQCGWRKAPNRSLSCPSVTLANPRHSAPSTVPKAWPQSHGQFFEHGNEGHFYLLGF